ncbi:hypothetical protein SAMN05421743_12154 [Thalassobacillus cyri]|uniref:Uncharacterized protein n=1 Tax=Thalassobacillus cyri TaxID=571932 RepID=A0A1H4H218_9BACI|nr:hypothetical protein [Thalassobacillus cyri]SEB15857.1 hypothetical protein SAMN05421743_12154 [Thalassobacillus cyri]
MEELDIKNRPDKDWVDEYLKEVIRYHRAIKAVPDSQEGRLIELKSKQLVFIGKLAGEFAYRYKSKRAERKQVQTETFFEAKKYKKEAAELAVVELRKEEAEEYGNWKRWENALTTTQEEINAIKYKVKLDFADGNRQGGF